MATSATQSSLTETSNFGFKRAFIKANIIWASLCEQMANKMYPQIHHYIKDHLD